MQSRSAHSSQLVHRLFLWVVVSQREDTPPSTYPPACHPTHHHCCPSTLSTLRLNPPKAIFCPCESHSDNSPRLEFLEERSQPRLNLHQRIPLHVALFSILQSALCCKLPLDSGIGFLNQLYSPFDAVSFSLPSSPRTPQPSAVSRGARPDVALLPKADNPNKPRDACASAKTRSLTICSAHL